jgi:hypothetical protein
MKKPLWKTLLYMPYIPSQFKPFDIDFDDLGTLPEPKAEGRSALDEESLASWMQENMLKKHRGVLHFGSQRLIVMEHCFVGKVVYSGIQNGDIATVGTLRSGDPPAC